MGEFNRDSAEREFLAQACRDFAAAQPDSGNDYESPDDDALRIVSGIYFRLNRAYKMWRIENGHWTRPEKIAALVTISIMLVRPFEIKAQTKESFYVNPLFAMKCGFAKLGLSLDTIDQRTITRMCRWLDRFRISSSRNSISIISSSIVTGEFIDIDDGRINLSVEEVVALDMMVSFYDVLALLGKHR